MMAVTFPGVLAFELLKKEIEQKKKRILEGLK